MLLTQTVCLSQNHQEGKVKLKETGRFLADGFMNCFLNRSVWDAKTWLYRSTPCLDQRRGALLLSLHPAQGDVSTMKYGDPTHMGRLSTSTNTQLIQHPTFIPYFY